MNVGGWLFDDNLGPFVNFLADLAGYDLLRDELTAITAGVRETDAEAGRWYEYCLGGKATVTCALARDPGTCVLHYRVDCPNNLVEQVEVAAGIMAEYRQQGGRAGQAGSPRANDWPAQVGKDRLQGGGPEVGVGSPEGLTRFLADAEVEVVSWSAASGDMVLRAEKDVAGEVGLLRFVGVGHVNLLPRLTVAAIVRGEQRDGAWLFQFREAWGGSYYVVAETVCYEVVT